MAVGNQTPLVVSLFTAITWALHSEPPRPSPAYPACECEWTERERTENTSRCEHDDLCLAWSRLVFL